MNEIVQLLTTLFRREGGFVIGRVALVVLVLAIIVAAALVALLIPN